MLVIGLIASFLKGKYNVPQPFIFYILSNFKWISIFLFIFQKNIFGFLVAGIIFCFKIKDSFDTSTFYDFITWVIFISLVCCIVYRPRWIQKLLLGVIFLLFVVFLQSEKYAYRNAIHYDHQKPGLATFENVYLRMIKENNGFFSAKNLAPSISRINQGFIISYVLKDVPTKVPLEKGREMLQVLEAAFLPRFLAPNKLKADDMANFKKYTPDLQYLGGKNTIMCLSPASDAYINFGIFGGWLFMFLLGLFYNAILKMLLSLQFRLPMILLFTPLVFYYSIRADGALETMLGQIVKSIIIICGILEVHRLIFVKKYSIKDIYSLLCKACSTFLKRSQKSPT